MLVMTRRAHAPDKARAVVVIGYLLLLVGARVAAREWDAYGQNAAAVSGSRGELARDAPNLVVGWKTKALSAR